MKTFRKILLAGEPFKNFHEYRIFTIDFLGTPHTALDTIAAVVCCTSVHFVLSEISQVLNLPSGATLVSNGPRSLGLWHIVVDL